MSGATTTAAPTTTTVDNTIVRRYYDAVQRRGRQITIRHITNGGALGPNPPSISGAVINGIANAGASALSIRGTGAFGRLLPGDQITYTNGTPITVTVAEAALANGPPVDPSSPWVPGFSSIPLTAPLPLVAFDGMPVTFTWVADMLVWCVRGELDLTLTANAVIDGQEALVIPAYGIAKPSITDQVMLGDVGRAITSITPVHQRGLIVAWNIQTG